MLSRTYRTCLFHLGPPLLVAGLGVSDRLKSLWQAIFAMQI